MTYSAISWDYLFVTASNDEQAKSYEDQLAIRSRLGLFAEVDQVVVVADPAGKRIGSGGSTVLCLQKVLEREVRDLSAESSNNPNVWSELFSKLRILIIHGGGDSKRLPAYGTCGKLFTPLPINSETALPTTLFDVQLPYFLNLLSNDVEGQVVVTSGDVFLRFNPEKVQIHSKGITGLGCFVEPELASRHGVYVADEEGIVQQFLQKPCVDALRKCNALNQQGQAMLDVGVINIDPNSAVKLLSVFQTKFHGTGGFRSHGSINQAVESHGFDIYREFCCSLGCHSTLDSYIEKARSSGSLWSQEQLSLFFNEFSQTIFKVSLLADCEFLHFGTSKELLTSTAALLQTSSDNAVPVRHFCVNSHITASVETIKETAWIEACDISGTLKLGGENLLVGVDVFEKLSLPAKACLDILPGRDRIGRRVFFIRCYEISDSFQRPNGHPHMFCGQPLEHWLSDVGATLEDVWDSKIPQAERSVWNARLFPAEKISTDYRRWLWMYRPEESTSQHRQDWLGSDRYSLAEVAAMSDHVEFHRLRVELHTRHLYQDVEAVFLINNSYSAEDLAIALENYSDPDEILNALLETLFARGGSNAEKTTVDFFLNSRVLHTLSSAMKNVANNPTDPVSSLFPNIASNLNPKYLEQLNALGVLFESDAQVQVVSDQLRRAAFSEIRKTIQGPPVVLDFPRRCLKNNETVWGRAPCRLDLAGGWTDTPPYSLNHGGVVLNAAINLDGETPVQVFVKPLEEPLFRLVSVDQGTTIEIQDYQELRSPQSLLTEFTLVTQALIQTGLAPNELSEKTPGTLRERIERFGGGLEITTRSTVPKGSGLGTSSILGAVVLAALHRTMGKTLSQRELFYETLRLEQALTSGGGWQDQVGGIVEEVKLISADPGLVPEFRIQQVQQELLDPRLNNNRTLLYYTGINRLAKDILEKVVGRYLDRDRVVMATLSNLHQLSIRLADVMNGMDYEQFGKMVSHAWQLNKHLDQSSTNTDVEKIMSLIQPYVYGAKLLGAGGGGFVLMVCRSEKHAKNVYQLLTDNPPNNQARFYGFEINSEGMVVSVV